MKYRYGSIIRYSNRTVLVDEKSSDIKNGFPGFGGIVVGGGPDNGMSVWGYDTQITDVISY